jgi:ferredoxin
MKNVIFYFSGTGNSLRAAQAIQKRIGKAELLKITPQMIDTMDSVDADYLGVVFPVYAWGPPAIVEQFLKKLVIKKAGYLFVVATHGGNPENTHKLVGKIINPKGVSVDGEFTLCMPGNYIIGINPPAGDELKSIISSAEKELSVITEKILRKEIVSGVRSTFPGSLKSSLVHPIFKRMLHSHDKKYSASEACTGCGVCAKVCPVDNIALNENKRPEWKHRCECCLACINWCPVHAIEHGSASRGRNRYHHPDIKLAQMD